MSRQTNQKRTIPLLKAPFLVLRKVVGQMEIDEIIELSLTSKRMARVLGQTQTMVGVPPPQMTVEIKDSDSHVLITDGKGPNELLVFTWYIGKNYFGKLLTTNIEGIKNTTRNQRTKAMNLEYCTRAVGKAVNSPMKTILERLLIVFPKMITHSVKFDTSFTFFDAKKALSAIKTVEHLEINGEMMTGNVRDMLENITVTKRLEMYCKVSIVRGPFDVASLPSEHIVCNYTTWMSTETFQQLKCQHTRIGKTKLTVKDVEEFLLKWKNSTEENHIKSLMMSTVDSETKLDYNLLGAEESEPSKKIHNEGGSASRIPFDNSIKRADGLVGLVRQNGETIHFRVD
ncbi:hypothetical protein CRE_20872 [Caenorhabditis remanei]|uniref:F-box domain-containing protein n=1 Tax=Caenorhabditis remanei TaxID=31234 RepID=E3MV15_CAERE|nr:hypothetical protein CRE_20872 [Caenorhabditis remanei]